MEIGILLLGLTFGLSIICGIVVYTSYILKSEE